MVAANQRRRFQTSDGVLRSVIESGVSSSRGAPLTIALLSSGITREHWTASALELKKLLLYAVTPQFEE